MTKLIICDFCKKQKKTTRFRINYNDFSSTYQNSNRKIIHSYFYDLCKKCLTKSNKLIKGQTKNINSKQ